jgi:chromosome segregation ATPase
MKLNELAAVSPTKQAAKVFESYFGNSIRFDQITPAQARGMLKRVRTLIAEHRRTPGFHSSEHNPSYLKLVMMEQALASQAVAPVGGAPMDPQKQAGLQAAQIQQNQKAKQDQLQALKQQRADLDKQINQAQQALNNPMAESKIARRLREASEIQQAQVVLAAQDMVDQVQKMSEQVSAMQFKDLPALVDQIKNEVGVDQATQFNGDASTALSGLLQNLQGAKQQLEASLGVVTGQAPQVPGEDMAAPAPGEEDVDIDAELPAPGEEEDVDAEMDANLDAGLGRERR